MTTTTSIEKDLPLPSPAIEPADPASEIDTPGIRVPGARKPLH